MLDHTDSANGQAIPSATDATKGTMFQPIDGPGGIGPGTWRASYAAARVSRNSPGGAAPRLVPSKGLEGAGIERKDRLAQSL
jgi:hypothetical protein